MLPYLVQTAHHITDQFLRDWQSQPYRWDYELDVQIELTSRLSAFCRLIGQDTVAGHYPDLWACEITYHAEEPDDWDSEKLTYLSKQGQVQYGCWITMLRSIAPSGMGITWDQELRNERIWLCKAQLPATA